MIERSGSFQTIPSYGTDHLLVPSERRKAKLKLEARMVVGHFDPGRVKTGDGGDKAQAEAVARSAAASCASPHRSSSAAS